MNQADGAPWVEQVLEGRRIRISRDTSKPLMLLVRLIPSNMGLWDNIWTRLAEHYTVATFNLPVPKIEPDSDPRAVLHHLAQECVKVARLLGHSRFHIFGWHGGAQVALRLAIDFPGSLLSCVLQGAIFEPLETRPTDIAVKIVEAVVSSGDLEFLTYYVLLTGVTPEYAESNFKVIRGLVLRRIEVDRGRLDAHQALSWGRMQRRYFLTAGEIDKITAPVLLVAPVGAVWPPFHLVMRLYQRMKTADLAIIPRGGDLIIFEDPDAFFAAAGRFLRAAARGDKPPAFDAQTYMVHSGDLRAAVSEPA